MAFAFLKKVYSKSDKFVPKLFPFTVELFQKGVWRAGKQTGSNKTISLGKMADDNLPNLPRPFKRCCLKGKTV